MVTMRYVSNAVPLVVLIIIIFLLDSGGYEQRKATE